MSKLAGLSSENMYQSILARNADTISIQKPEVALRKLELIINAALELSNKKGFEAMSLRDLSKASGVSMGGMYAYFDSKTTLLNMILLQVTDTAQRVLEMPPETIASDPVAHLEWLIETHIRLTEAMLPWFTFCFMEAKSFPARERRIATNSEEVTEDYFAKVIDKGVRAGVFKPDVSPLLASLIKPLLQDWYIKRGKYRRRGVKIQEYIETVQNIVLTACLNTSTQHPLLRDENRLFEKAIT